jgi:hypothetical protein
MGQKVVATKGSLSWNCCDVDCDIGYTWNQIAQNSMHTQGHTQMNANETGKILIRLLDYITVNSW